MCYIIAITDFSEGNYVSREESDIQLYASLKKKLLDLDICLNRIRVTGNRTRIALYRFSETCLYNNNHGMKS